MSDNCSENRRLGIQLFGKTMPHGELGFTMVEVLVALAILAITIVPLMGLFTLAPMLHQHREQKLRAGFLAQLRLEQVKNEIIQGFDEDCTDPVFDGNGYDKSSGDATDFNPPEGDPEEGLFEPSDAEYRYTVEDNINLYLGVPPGSEPPDPPPPPLMRDVTVTVWHDKNGNNTLDSDEQEIELITKVARRRM
jgi:prepilin-type N-terminal cleavage/methylation domain-containing protein